MRYLVTHEEIIFFTNNKILHLDVADEESISEAIDKIISEKGGIDIVVNNVWYSWEQLHINEIKEEFETNFFGIIKLIQSVLPMVRKQGYGRIINMSSLAGRIGFPLSSVYVSSKFALEALVDPLDLRFNHMGY